MKTKPKVILTYFCSLQINNYDDYDALNHISLVRIPITENKEELETLRNI